MGWADGAPAAVAGELAIAQAALERAADAAQFAPGVAKATEAMVRAAEAYESDDAALPPTPAPLAVSVRHRPFASLPCLSRRGVL
jgi:hypothetical protein